MLSKFDSKGEICEATIQPIAGDEVKTSSTVLSQHVVDLLVDEVAPPSERGRRERFLDPDSTVAGGVYRMKTNYALVTVETVGFFSETPTSETVQFVVIK